MFKYGSLLMLLLAFVLFISPSYAQSPPAQPYPQKKFVPHPPKNIVPINRAQFAKTISDGTYCSGGLCAQKGVVTYHRDGNYMIINSLDEISKDGTSLTKNNIKDLNLFLEDKRGIENPDYARVFNRCFDSICDPLGEIPNITYPGMNETRVIYVIETDEEFWGHINIFVFARKDDQYVMLSKSTYLKTHDDMTDKPMPLYKQCLDKYGLTREINSTPNFMNCYKAKLKADTAIQGILKREAEALIEFFAITKYR